MFSNLSAEAEDYSSIYPRLDSGLAFEKYIAECQSMIASRRTDLPEASAIAANIINANSPFELKPAHQNTKMGAILVHGLLDCPFTFRELASHLQQHDIATQAVLLPGHGTRPADLLHVTYQAWQDTLRYSVEKMRATVDKIIIVGYSTGAALALVHALEGHECDGLVLMAPAIKLRMQIDLTVNWLQLTNHLGKEREWIYHMEENDYVKYRSIALNGAVQVAKLTELVRSKSETNAVKQPLFMILSREDETISSPDSVNYFINQSNPLSQMLLYTSSHQEYADPRIKTRSSMHPDKNIASLSHPALLFSEDNSHYGANGDYCDASRNDTQKYIDGAYNRIEIHAFDVMAKYNLVKYPRRILTYNPDFRQLADDIVTFMMKIAN